MSLDDIIKFPEKHGIYKITSPSGKIYIGESLNFKNSKEVSNFLGCSSSTIRSYKAWGFIYKKIYYKRSKLKKPRQLTGFFLPKKVNHQTTKYGYDSKPKFEYVTIKRPVFGDLLPHI